MINRELIRIKVVQMLYSSLISDSSFSIEQPSENPTREKRFAYQAYIALLAVMVMAAEEIVKRGGRSPLADTRFIKAIRVDDRVASVLRRSEEGSEIARIASSIASEIKDSAIYKRFLKDGEADHRIWESIYKYIIAENSEWGSYVASLENYTLHGVERVRELLEKTFANFYSSSDNASEALKMLQRSMEQSRNLYIRLLSLPIAITEMRKREIEDNRTKYNPGAEDINPNLRFVENKLVALLESDPDLERELDKNDSLRWLPDDFTIVRSLLRAVMKSELYSEYMDAPGEPTLEQDAEFWRDVYKKIIFDNEDFLAYLEEKSVFWNGDLDILGEFLLKTLKRYGIKGLKADGLVDSQMLPMYKDREDEQFGRKLFERTIRNRVEYRQYIKDAVENSKWDSDRLALMDVVIIMTALAEITGFPSIPVQVSINEYVDIAKCYSTAKSSAFVHGILGAIIPHLPPK